MKYRFHLVGQLTTGKRSAIVYDSITRVLQFCGIQYWLQLTIKSQFILSHKRGQQKTHSFFAPFLQRIEIAFSTGGLAHFVGIEIRASPKQI